MNFERDARKTGMVNLLVGTIALSAAGALQFFFLSKPDVSFILAIGIWLVAGFVGLIFCWQGISLILSGGTWKIRVNEEGVSWESPNQSVDRSFNLKLSEIERVEIRVRRRKGKTSTNRRYYLMTESGLEQKLSPNSGINLVQVVTTLERLGVKSETITEG